MEVKRLANTSFEGLKIKKGNLKRINTFPFFRRTATPLISTYIEPAQKKLKKIARFADISVEEKVPNTLQIALSPFPEEFYGGRVLPQTEKLTFTPKDFTDNPKGFLTAIENVVKSFYNL